MFFKSVFNHSKPLFLLMIIFIAGQLFINYKRGVVFSPFYHYGMYSEVMDVQPSYNVWEVEINGRKLSAKDYSIQQWDKILLPLQYYSGIHRSNTLYNQDIRRLLGKLHISANARHFLSGCNYHDFENWYKGYLHSITGERVTEVQVTYRNYQFQNVLVPTDSVTPLHQLCN